MGWAFARPPQLLTAFYIKDSVSQRLFRAGNCRVLSLRSTAILKSQEGATSRLRFDALRLVAFRGEGGAFLEYRGWLGSDTGLMQYLGLENRGSLRYATIPAPICYALDSPIGDGLYSARLVSVSAWLCLFEFLLKNVIEAVASIVLDPTMCLNDRL